MVESLGDGRGKRKYYGKLTMNKTNLLVSPGFLIILKTVRKLNCFSATKLFSVIVMLARLFFILLLFPFEIKG